MNVVGYCLGGILLSATAAYLQAKGDDRIASASYLTTMVDFEEVGEISLFIDESPSTIWKRRSRPRACWTGAASPRPGGCCAPTT